MVLISFDVINSLYTYVVELESVYLYLALYIISLPTLDIRIVIIQILICII